METNEDINAEAVIADREKLEQKALASLTTDILKKLNISVDNLPQKCQNLLQQTAQYQTVLKLNNLDSPSICLYRSKETSGKLNEDYEILKLKQKNAELQLRIDRNNKFLDGLRKELEDSKKSLMSQNPNPENIQEHLRQLKQKLASYEESYDKAKSKYAILSVPEAILPKSLNAQVTTLLALKEEAMSLKQRADDVTLVKEARDVFSRLRR